MRRANENIQRYLLGLVLVRISASSKCQDFCLEQMCTKFRLRVLLQKKIKKNRR